MTRTPEQLLESKTLKSQTLDKSGVSWNDFPTVDERSFLESVRAQTSRSFHGVQFGSERGREPDPYNILEASSGRRNRFEQPPGQGASLSARREGMKSLTFTNGQKVFRKSVITRRPKPRAKQGGGPRRPEKSSSAAPGKMEEAPGSPEKRALSRPRLVETPEKAILVERSEERVSVNRLLVEEAGSAALDIHRDLEARAPRLKIKETISVGASEEGSEGDSSIVMKSDLTEEPLSKRSISPIRSNARE